MLWFPAGRPGRPACREAGDRDARRVPDSDLGEGHTGGGV